MHQKTSFTLTHKFAWKKCLSVQNQLFPTLVQSNLSLVFKQSTSGLSYTGVRHKNKVNDSRDGLSSSWKSICHTQNHRNNCTHPVQSGLALETPLVPQGTSPSSRSQRLPPATLTSEDKVAGEDKWVWIGHCLTLLSCYKSYLHNY